MAPPSGFFVGTCVHLHPGKGSLDRVIDGIDEKMPLFFEKFHKVRYHFKKRSLGQSVESKILDYPQVLLTARPFSGVPITIHGANS